MSIQTVPPSPERTELRGKVIFLICLSLITLCRFYFLRGEDIITNTSRYDDYLYVQLGEHAFWGRPPDETSLVRLPVYPLWIWLCHHAGVPLYFGTNLLVIAASLFLVYALRKLDFPRSASAVVYAALLFEINGIDSMRHAVASNLYGSLLIATLGWMALALASTRGRQLWIASAGIAISLALFTVTRAESILAWIIFVVFVASVALREIMERGRKNVALQTLVAAGLLPVLGMIAAPLIVATANKSVFGVFTSCSLTSPAFSAAINQLLAIKPEKDIPYVPVTRDAREKAYAVSPAFAQLKPIFEGPVGLQWGRHAARLYKVAPQEVGGGWFLFALRRGIEIKTTARTPAEHDAYYRRIANELKAAFAAGKLPKRRVWVSLVQPDPTIWGRLPHSLGRVFAATLRPPAPRNILDAARSEPTIPAIEELYDRVTYRRSLDRRDTIALSGWAFSNGQPVSAIRASTRDGAVLPVTLKAFPWAAVSDADKDLDPSLDPQAPLGFEATVSLQSEERTGATMNFVFADGAEVPVQVAGLRSKKIAVGGGGGTQQTGWLGLASVTHTGENPPDILRATRQMAGLTKFYSLAFRILVVAVIPALILLAIFRGSPAHNRRLYLWLLPVLGFVAARVALLASIDATSFAATATQYLNTLASTMVLGVIVLNAQAILVVRAIFRRQSAP